MKPGLLSTGIEKLDQLLEGGIPEGFTTLILGVPGSSKEILAKQLTTNGSSVYFSTEETRDMVLDTMKRFNWSTEDTEIIDIATTYSEALLQNQQDRVDVFKQRTRVDIRELISKGSSGIPTSIEGMPDFLAMLLETTVQLTSPKKIIINSLDFFLNQYPQEDVIKIVNALKMKNLLNKGTLFIMITKGIHGAMFERKLEVMADCVIELSLSKKGTIVDRYLTIKKMRDYARKIGIATYVIDDTGFTLETITRII